MRLYRDVIRLIAAKRGLSKLCLISLWGKFLERGNRTQTKLILDPNKLYRFLATPGVVVVKLWLASVRFAWNCWRYTVEEQFASLHYTNEVVACCGRMQIYAYLDKFGERALYCETDNVYICSEGRRTASNGMW